MRDFEHRIKTLERKVKLLEETLETLKNMNLSEQMDSFIQSRQEALRFVDLVSSGSNDKKLNFEKERKALDNLQTAKKKVDEQIAHALKNTCTFSDDFPADPRYFTYEIESGIISLSWDESRKVKCEELASFIGKGIRITGYNGFETDIIVVPPEIDGLPVLTIGEKVFMNAPLSKVILPKTIKALLSKAFFGCTNLTGINLPEGLTFIDRECFRESGLLEITLPNSLEIIPNFCFDKCANLTKVVLGNNLLKADICAFRECKRLRNLVLPDTLREIGRNSFEDTSIETLVFPQSVKKVSHELFGDEFSRTKRQITCAFLGMDTEITEDKYHAFLMVTEIYCLPGSAVQRYAREKKIPMKPLSEFRFEDYQ